MTKKTQHNIKHTSIATLTQEEQQKLLIQAIADFQEEKICLDDLSSIGSSIFPRRRGKRGYGSGSHNRSRGVAPATKEAGGRLRHLTARAGGSFV